MGIFKDTLASLIFLANCSVLVVLAIRAINLMGMMDDAHWDSPGSKSGDKNAGINSEKAKGFAEELCRRL